MPKITLDGKYTTRGEPMTVVCVNAPGDYPVIAYGPNGSPRTFTADGKFSGNGRWPELDLILVPEPTEAELAIKELMETLDELMRLYPCLGAGKEKSALYHAYNRVKAAGVGEE